MKPNDFSPAPEIVTGLEAQARGAQEVIDAHQPCTRCLGTGLIFIKITARGDRLSEVCKCPAGDSERRAIDQSERQIARDERARDIGRGECNW